MKTQVQCYQSILRSDMLSAPNPEASQYDATTKVGPFEAILLLSDSNLLGHFPDFTDQAGLKQTLEGRSAWLMDKCGIDDPDQLPEMRHIDPKDLAGLIPARYPPALGGGRVKPAVKSYLKWLIDLIDLWVNRYQGVEDPTAPAANPDSQARTQQTLWWWKLHLQQFSTDVSITTPKSTDSDSLEFGPDYHVLQAFLDGWEQLMKKQCLMVEACHSFTGNIANDVAAQVLLMSVLAKHQDVIRGIKDFTFVHQSIAYLKQHYLTGETKAATSAMLRRTFKDYDFSNPKPFQEHVNHIKHLKKGLETCSTPLQAHEERELLLAAITKSKMDEGLDRPVFDNTAMNELEAIQIGDEDWGDRFMGVFRTKYQMWLERKEMSKALPGKAKESAKPHNDVLLALTDQVATLAKQMKKRPLEGGQRRSDSPKKRKTEAKTNMNYFIDPKEFPKEAEDIKRELIRVNKDYKNGTITSEQLYERKAEIKGNFKPFMRDPSF
jgi:hypothetical protein